MNRCLSCNATDDLVAVYGNQYLCIECDGTAQETTFCGVCGIIVLIDDAVYASNGDGPHCPDCIEAVEDELITTAAQLDMLPDDWDAPNDDDLSFNWGDE